MNLLIRVDGDDKIGMGHVVRMRLLAGELLNRNIKCAFLVKANTPAVSYLKKYFDKILTFNKYTDEINLFFQAKTVLLDIRWTSEKKIKSVKKKGIYILDMDDTGPGRKWADVLIDSNRPALHTGISKHVKQVKNSKKRSGYPQKGLTKNFSGRKKGQIKLFGPCYQVIDPCDKPLKKIRSSVKNVLVCFGGADPALLTEKVLRIISQKKFRSFRFHIAAGDFISFTRKKIIKQYAKKCDNINLCTGQSSLSKFYRRMDMAIISGGIMLYEAAAYGCPSVCIPQKPHQERIARRFVNAGAVKLCVNDFVDVFFEVAGDVSLRKKMSACGQKYVDGKGLYRIADFIEKKLRYEKKTC